MALDEVMEMAARRGFFWQGFRDVYSDAPAGLWVYGPLGVKMKNKVIELWREKIVRREEGVELDSTCISPGSVFEASGHTKHFNDKLVECLKCHRRHRADMLLEEQAGLTGLEGLSEEELYKLIVEKMVKCPYCGSSEFSEVRRFNLMFEMRIGATGKDIAYLRPETTQSSVVEIRRLQQIARNKLPLVICQVGKAFRNEISPRHGLIRTREFNMAEVQIFFDPEYPDYDNKFESVRKYRLRFLPAYAREAGEVVEMTCEEALEEGYTINKLVTYWLALYQKLMTEDYGFPLEKVRYYELNEHERAHYARAHWDLQIYSEDLGWVEVVNNAYRTDHDVIGHSRLSGRELKLYSEKRKQSIVPHMYEPSIGIDRLILHLLLLNYRREGERVVEKLPRRLAPIDVAVFPLVNKPELIKAASEIYGTLLEDFEAFYDESGSIGRRYRRMDEIGTPVCVTVDYQTLEDKTVTLRDRDTMAQVRVHVDELKTAIKRFIAGEPLEKLGTPMG
ncbi:MAG: glycine--tRNA ligase [Thermoproteota archaeon]|nr:MAG: glycine--tRNA ligase [Candidatus Korarchaeota archaeon]